MKWFIAAIAATVFMVSAESASAQYPDWGVPSCRTVMYPHGPVRVCQWPSQPTWRPGNPDRSMPRHIPIGGGSIRGPYPVHSYSSRYTPRYSQPYYRQSYQPSYSRRYYTRGYVQSYGW